MIVAGSFFSGAADSQVKPEVAGSVVMLGLVDSPVGPKLADGLISPEPVAPSPEPRPGGMEGPRALRDAAVATALFRIPRIRSSVFSLTSGLGFYIQNTTHMGNKYLMHNF